MLPSESLSPKIDIYRGREVLATLIFFRAPAAGLLHCLPDWDFAWGFPAPKRVTTFVVNRPRVHTSIV